MIEKGLSQIINKQINTEFDENISMHESQEKLTVLINDLIQKDFQKLISILYKVDVDESKLKKLLKENPEKDAAYIIANLVIERESQKVKTLKQF
jgi:hypothetical protein